MSVAVRSILGAPLLLGRITRVPYRPTTGIHKEVDLKLPDGDWAVWWYSRLRINTRGDVPLVEVQFQRLAGNELTGEIITRLISIARLGLYRIGALLVDRLIREKILFTEQMFDVDFNIGGYRLQPIKALNLCSPSSEYFIPVQHGGDFALTLKQPRGALVLNCVEYFVRGYSTNSEIHRILTTFKGTELKERLYNLGFERERDKSNDDPEEWIVCPHRGMVHEDRELLARYRYKEPRTEQAVNRIYSQFSSKYREGQPHNFVAIPWFSGPAKLKCRGLRINGGQDFFCTEITGVSKPSTRTVRFLQPEAAKDELVGDAKTRPIGTNYNDTDGLEEFNWTDVRRPGISGPTEEVLTDSFEVMRDCELVVDKVSTLHEKQRIIPKDSEPPSKHSTAEPEEGGDKDTGKAVIRTKPVEDSSDHLRKMWNALNLLGSANNFEVNSYIPPDILEKGPPLNCTLFMARTEEQAEHTAWIDFGEGVRRGMLLVHIKKEGKQFLVIEIQRKPVKKAAAPHSTDGTQPTGEGFCGVICQISDLGQCQSIYELLDAALPSQKGVFSKVAKHLPLPQLVFQHRQRGNMGKAMSSAVRALEHMHINCLVPLPDKENPMDAAFDTDT